MKLSGIKIDTLWYRAKDMVSIPTPLPKYVIRALLIFYEHVPPAIVNNISFDNSIVIL